MDQEFINQLAEKLSKLGTKRPLGFHYAHPFGTVPPDSIICNGAEYNRALYADFFAYATEQGWVKTEAEWQEIANQNNGYCSYYSEGDGSTTFRTPKFAPFMQTAIASSNVGKYHAAGLPNIQGGGTTNQSVGGWSESSANISQGALKTTVVNRGPRSQSSYRDGFFHMISLDASKSNSIYGGSSTVQPESSEWMICVVVFGVATNVGSTDVSNVMSAVAQVQAELPNKLNNTTAHIVKTWHSGETGYRIWSDGFIEQWGVTQQINSTSLPSYKDSVSLLTPFTTTSYTVLGSARGIESNASGAELIVTSRTTSTFTATTYDCAGYYNFYAFGY